MTQYSMTPLNNGTRMRTDHNTFATIITSYNRGQLVVGNEIWEAPADGPEASRPRERRPHRGAARPTRGTRACCAPAAPRRSGSATPPR